MKNQGKSGGLPLRAFWLCLCMGMFSTTSFATKNDSENLKFKLYKVKTLQKFYKGLRRNGIPLVGTQAVAEVDVLKTEFQGSTLWEQTVNASQAVLGCLNDPVCRKVALKVTGAQTFVSSTSNLEVFSSKSQSAIINGLAALLIDRAKQELVLAFLEKFGEKLCGDDKKSKQKQPALFFREAFKNTCTIYDKYKISMLAHAGLLAEAVQEDYKNLPSNLIFGLSKSNILLQSTANWFDREIRTCCQSLRA